MAAASNALTTEVLELVQRLARGDPTFVEYRLENAFVGDAGALAIAEALRENSTLQQLMLSSNHIGVGGAQAMAQALRAEDWLPAARK